MGSDSKLALRVGIFFTVAVIVALGLSLQVGKGGYFSEQYEVVANFRESQGIERGTRVTLRGVPIGLVQSLDWDAEKYRVRVILEIDRKYEIPRNATARIQINSLLGGNIVNIDMEEGPAEMAYLGQGDEIQTKKSPSLDEVLTQLQELSSDSESFINNLDENQRLVMAKINDVIDENRGYIQQTSESFARVGPKVEALSDRLNEVTEYMKSGQGTIGRLYAEEDVYNDLKTFGDSAREVAEQVKSGEGSLGALIYKDNLAVEAETTMKDLQGAAKEVEAAVGENRSELKTLIANLSGAGTKVEEAITNFNDISTKINSGEGTLARLVNDPSLYEDAQKAVQQVGDSFETTEEQGVFRSFLGLIFGALI